jgi:hypothetical protein
MITDCGFASSLTGGDAAIQCPNSICSGFNADGVPVQFVAGGGGASGYLSSEQIAAGLKEVNGQFLTNAQYNDYIQAEYAKQIDAQRRDLARAMADNSKGTISYKQAYDSLNTDDGHPQGGNYNFVDKIYGPGNLSCGADASRCNGVHFPGQDANGNFYVHLDSANPFTGPRGFLEHSFVDVFLGNVAYTIIPRPWP